MLKHNIFDFTNKTTTALSLKGLQLTPKFENAEVVSRLRHIISVAMPSVYINEDAFFSMLPNINSEPVPLPVSRADTFGFVKLNALQYFLRANMNNVRSCHGFYPSSAYNNGGNLNYLANPNWACYGIYIKGKDGYGTCRLDASTHYTVKKEDVSELPNLLATLNVCFGYVNGYPSVMLSRMYGDTGVDIRRLISYFNYTLKLRVYMHVSYSNIYSRFKQSAQKDQATFYSIPLPAQVVRQTAKQHTLVARYPDIDEPRGTTRDRASGPLVVAEHHTVQLVSLPDLDQNSNLAMAKTMASTDYTSLTSFAGRLSVAPQVRPIVKGSTTCCKCSSVLNTINADNRYVENVGYFCSEKCVTSYLERVEAKVEQVIKKKATRNAVFTPRPFQMEVPPPPGTEDPVEVGKITHENVFMNIYNNTISRSGRVGGMLEVDLSSLERLVAGTYTGG